MNKQSDQMVKYNRVAVTLHWVMAIAFLFMISTGLLLEYGTLGQALKFNMYQWHKSMGVLLLCAFFVRIFWRLFKPVPALPENFSPRDMLLAKLGHWGLYLFMFLIPLSGWVMVSSSVYGLPTIVFGWFEWPHIPYIQGDKIVNAAARNAHWIMAYIFIVMIFLHVAAVAKHYIFDKVNLLRRMGWVLALFLFAAAQTAQAQTAMPYEVDTDQSQIQFSGTHAGKIFNGQFMQWHAVIVFSQQDLENSHAQVTLQTGSAKTGNAMYDGTLPQADWFDSQNYPEAVFTAEEIKQDENGQYFMRGILQIRNIEQPISFPFALEQDDEGGARVQATFPISRLAFDIGKGSDANAEWVSDEIQIVLDILARAN